jgi:hypothetical protein
MGCSHCGSLLDHVAQEIHESVLPVGFEDQMRDYPLPFDWPTPVLNALATGRGREGPEFPPIPEGAVPGPPIDTDELSSWLKSGTKSSPEDEG